MFGRKKKKLPPLFGAQVEPQCSYCGHYHEGMKKCLLNLELKEGQCKKYQYDPLRRPPRPMPKLEKQDLENFKL